MSKALAVEEGITLLSGIHESTKSVLGIACPSMEELRSRTDIAFAAYFLPADSDSRGFYHVLADKMINAKTHHAFQGSLKQAISFRVHDVVRDIVLHLPEEYFTTATLNHHKCNKGRETVSVLKLHEDNGEVIFLYMRGSMPHFFRQSLKDSQAEPHIDETEGPDHDVHYKNQLDHSGVVDHLQEIIRGLSDAAMMISQIEAQ